MSADILVVHATTHQHCALEVAQKLRVSVGLVVRIIRCTKAGTFQDKNRLGEATIHGVGVQITANLSAATMLRLPAINKKTVA